MNDALRDQLHRTADTVDFTVPDLRPRAKAARTRRRLLGMGAVATTVLLTVAIIVPLNLGGSRAVPAETTAPSPPVSPLPTPSTLPTQPNTIPDPSSGQEPVVAHEEIIDRCRSQLAPSVKAFGPVPDDLRVARKHEYREGDVVRLVSDSGWDPSALCIVPSADATINVHDALEAALTLDATQDGVLLEVCSELSTNDYAIGLPEYAYDTYDLRSGAVVSHIELNGLHHALINLDEEWRVECGWEFRPDATINAFAIAQPATGFEFEIPAMGIEPVYAAWDGVSEYARVAVWGLISPELGTEDIVVWGGINSTIVFSRPLGLYQVITHVIPTGTADDWTAVAPPYMVGDDDFQLTVIARDTQGDEVLSVEFSVIGPTPSTGR